MLKNKKIHLTENREVIFTWLYNCWKAGLLCVFIVLLSRSAFKAKSESVFHGGWYDVTSSPCKFNGESWRTGELATIGIPCMAPYPNLRPSFSCCICNFIWIVFFLSLHRLFWNQTRITRGDSPVISTSCSFIRASGRGFAL